MPGDQALTEIQQVDQLLRTFCDPRPVTPEGVAVRRMRADILLDRRLVWMTTRDRGYRTTTASHSS